VVEGADEIEVGLNDSRKPRAKVIGTDPETDLAILKITLDRLPVITLGNSDALQVGDQVLAIGNPSASARRSPAASSARWGATSWASTPSRTSSRPTRRSIPATPAVRWSMSAAS
jgi:S1-C subfamily serine protease